MNYALYMTCGAAGLTATSLLIADWLFGRRRRIRRRIHQAAQAAGRVDTSQATLFRDWEVAERDSNRLLSRYLHFVQQSGLSISWPQLLAGATSLGMMAAALAWLVASHAVIITAAGVLGLVSPFVFVWHKRRKRIQQFIAQLPEAFDVMQRAVQAGQTMPSAFQLVAAECRPPLAVEFGLCSEQQNLGLPHDDTLRELAQRIPVVELQIFVIALMIQRHCGGSPVEILSNMSVLIRKRLRLKNRVRALTGEGRLQAIVLTVLPIAAFVWLWITRPEYIQTLIERPKLLAAVALLQIVGTIWVRRTIRIDY